MTSDYADIISDSLTLIDLQSTIYAKSRFLRNTVLIPQCRISSRILEKLHNSYRELWAVAVEQPKVLRDSVAFFAHLNIILRVRITSYISRNLLLHLFVTRVEVRWCGALGQRCAARICRCNFGVWSTGRLFWTFTSGRVLQTLK